jgi:hypothetical protein
MNATEISNTARIGISGNSDERRCSDGKIEQRLVKMTGTAETVLELAIQFAGQANARYLCRRSTRKII